MQALNTRISHHKSNIRLPEYRKLNLSKHLFECSNGFQNSIHIPDKRQLITSNKRNKTSQKNQANTK